jgi:hypothetical protein
VKKTLKVNGVVVGEVESTGDPDADTAIMRQFLEAKGIVREVPLAKSIFMQALSFCRAASVLQEHDLTRDATTLPMVAPFVVTATFAAELYLKVLHEVCGHSARGHNLLDLFDGLPESTRNRIAQLAARYASAFGVPEVSSVTVRATVESLATAFVEWRYWYESGDAPLVKVQPLVLTLKALDEACREAGAA